MKKYLFIALGVGFLLLGFNAYQMAKPVHKAPIYKTIREFSPYYIEKRFGGLEIMSKKDPDFKEKPNNMEIYHRLDSLEKKWGESHLKLSNSRLTILDDNGSTIKSLDISNREDIDFIHSFYGIK